MNFFKRAFCCLTRKKSKTVILFCVLLLAETMILCTVTILRASEKSKATLQEKTKSKITAEILEAENPLNSDEASKIKNLKNVVSINRSIKLQAYPSDFVLITNSTSEEEDNWKLQIQSYDDLETDGPFADGQIRLTKGSYPKKENEILVHNSLAEKNRLQLGDEVNFETTEGNTAQAVIVGLFAMGSGIEDRQSENTLAVYRVENTIYTKVGLAAALSNREVYESFTIYLKNPELMEESVRQISEILQGKAEITKADTLYQQMKHPLEQVVRVSWIMLLLTAGTSAIVITLLLCMWMRSRKKEMAIYISLGESKYSILLQTFLESFSIFFISTGASIGSGLLLARVLEKFLRSEESAAGISLQIGFQAADLGILVGIGGGILLLAVGISLVPVFCTRPKDTLSEMEG